MRAADFPLLFAGFGAPCQESWIRKECRTVLTSERLADYAKARPGSGFLDDSLRFYDTARQLILSVSIIDCLAAELSVAGNRYVAYGGDFYRVDAAFLDEINAEVKRLPNSTLTLPAYDGHNEEYWNNKVASSEPDHFVCLDRSLIHLPGQTPFEACDIVSTDGHLIHTKRYGQSSKMGFVLHQAEVSCQALTEVPEAREQLRAQVFQRAANPSAAAAVCKSLESLTTRPPDNEVVIVILGRWKNRTVTSLPLLTKIGLIGAFARLSRLGFKPTLSLVDLVT